MTQPGEVGGWSLEGQRDYLLLLARCRVPRTLRSRLDPGDVVQETFRRAYQHRHQCQAKTDAEFRGWLGAILKNHVFEELGRILPPVSLQALEESSQQWEMPDDQSTPSQRLMREEQLVRLAAALARLPEDQRQAVQFHHLDGYSRAEVAQQMNRSEQSVNGLLIRGLRKLRGLLDPQ